MPLTEALVVGGVWSGANVVSGLSAPVHDAKVATTPYCTDEAPGLPSVQLSAPAVVQTVVVVAPLCRRTT
ncbi:MAG: hypothetical protein ACR2GB_02700 [Nocardioidaceae bacterium]